jgi:hypothetical protein
MTPEARTVALSVMGVCNVTCEMCGKLHVLGKAEWRDFPLPPQSP